MLHENKAKLEYFMWKKLENLFLKDKIIFTLYICIYIQKILLQQR